MGDREDPPGDPEGSSPQEPSQATRFREAFASQLRAAIKRKGWSLSETARQASKFMPDGARIARAHVWHYAQGKALPRHGYLVALSLALEVSPDELLPFGVQSELNETRQAEEASITVLDQGDGTVFLELRQQLPWEVALRVIRIVKEYPDPLLGET